MTTLTNLHINQRETLRQEAAKLHYLELPSTERLIAEATEDLMQQIEALGIDRKLFPHSSDISLQWNTPDLCPRIIVWFSSGANLDHLYDNLLEHPSAYLNWDGSRLRVSLTATRSWVVAQTELSVTLKSSDRDTLIDIGRIQMSVPEPSFYTTC